MYAIISDGGRQYKVEQGQELEVDLRSESAGDEVSFDVLAISGDGETKIGTPTVDGATVTAEVVTATRGEKLVIQKFRRRKNSRRKTGHRQMYTKIRIKEISG